MRRGEANFKGVSSSILRRALVGILLLAIIVGSASLSAGTQSGTDWSSLIAAIKPTVVWILAEVPEGTAAGSGFIISPDGYILTAAHVVENASKVTVVVRERDQYQATISQYNREADVALLKISASGLTWVGLGNSDLVAYEEEIRVLGYPIPQAGVGFIAVAGVVQGFRQRDNVQLIQHNAPTDSGHSGGAVINSQGEVIGIHSEFWSKHSEFRLGVAINTAKRFIPSGVIPPGPPPTQPKPPPAPPKRIINVPGDYSSIQEAIDAAPEGAIIRVSPELHYIENVRISKTLNLVGIGPDLVTIEAANPGPVVTISGNATVTVKGFAVTGSFGEGPEEGIGFLVKEVTRVAIVSCRIYGNESVGIQAEGTARVTIQGTKVDRNNDGIFIYESAQGVIEANEISNNGTGGILAWPQFGTVIIRDNVISEHQYGLYFAGSPQVTVEGNRIFNNSHDGVTIRESAYVMMQSNQISDNAEEGISVYEKAQVVIGKNDISRNESGVYLEGFAKAVISNNTISNHEGCGIVSYSSEEVEGEKNKLVNNGLDLCGNLPGELRIPLRESTETEIVFPNQAYLTLQEAVDALKPGGMIILQPGSYKAGVTIAKKLHLKTAEGEAFLEKRATKRPVGAISLVGGADVQVEKISIEGLIMGDTARAISLDNYFADLVHLYGEAQLSLQKGIISEGIALQHQAYATFDGAQIFGFGGSLEGGHIEVSLNLKDNSQVALKSCEVKGIWLRDSARATISACQKAGQIVAEDSSQITISDTTLTYLDLRESAQVVLIKSTIAWTGGSFYDNGVLVADSAKLRLQDSIIKGHRFTGLVLKNSSEATISNSEISNNNYHGIFLTDSAQVTIQNSRILNNKDCGIWKSESAQARGGNNEMRGNGVDLCGFAPASLRKPLVPQTDRRQLSVPGDYSTVQEAIDAISPGGVIILAEGTYQEGLTLWKPLILKGASPEKTMLKALPDSPWTVSIIAEAQGSSMSNVTITGARLDGLLIYGEVTLADSQVVANTRNGLDVNGPAKVIVRSSQISGNGGSGMEIRDSAKVEAYNNKIFDNKEYGVKLYLPACGASSWDKDRHFRGEILGSGNEIYNNSKGDLCPPTGSYPWPQGFAIAPMRPGCTVTVSPTQLIQSAIDSAPAGAVICLPAGTWEENVIITKSVSLKGENQEQTVIKGAREGQPVIRIVSNSEISVTVEGLTVREAKGDRCVAWDPDRICPHGIQVLGRAKATISNVQILGTKGMWGLFVAGSGQVTVRDSSLSNNWLGLVPRDSAQVTVQDSTIADNGHGILGGDSAKVTIQNSIISNNGSGGDGGIGLGVHDTVQLTVADSRITGNRREGFYVSGRAQVITHNTEVTSNELGLFVKGSAQVTLRDSIITYNERTGIDVGESARLELYSTAVENNGVADGCHVEDEWGGIWICNGVTARDRSQVIIKDSRISNNADWGIAVSLKKCGYYEDRFTGQVILQGDNVIEGNNKAGNHQGEVCLP